MRLETARRYSGQLVKMLGPHCERLEVAGSVRRLKEEPRDIELVALPKFSKVAEGIFEDEPVLENELDRMMRLLVQTKVFARAEPVQFERNGRVVVAAAPFSERYYRIRYLGEQVDLFVVRPPASWGVTMLLRTGPVQFNKWIVTAGWSRGIYFSQGRLVRHADAKGRYIPGGQPCDHLNCVVLTLPTPEERDVFEALQVPWVAPESRTGRPSGSESAQVTGAAGDLRRGVSPELYPHESEPVLAPAAVRGESMKDEAGDGAGTVLREQSAKTSERRETYDSTAAPRAVLTPPDPCRRGGSFLWEGPGSI